MFPERLRAFAAEFDRRLDAYLKPTGDVPPELLAAVRYSVLAPGKRLRPYLLTRCCELAGGDLNRAWPVAAAVECVHAFSLIHDDLPAMDDDDLRRGQPTCHKKFTEATAILAGDALVMLAFELLARHVEDSALAGQLVLELASGAGWAGMTGGQAADLQGAKRPPSMERVEYIHAHKTARLFEASCRLGVIVAEGDPDTLEALGTYGQMVGRAFQIADDLLDVTASAETLGKGVGKDVQAGKQTYPQCVGIRESRAAAESAIEAALRAIDTLGSEVDELRALARYAADRNY